jgi:uncharacterized membrane protein YjgN (DUF898 family)
MKWVLSCETTGQEFELSNGDSLGRCTSTHRFPECKKLSKTHCQFLIEKDGSLYVTDLNSTNGTKVNGNRIDPMKRVRLKDSDVIRCGKMNFKLEQQAGLSQEFTSQTVTSTLTKSILKKHHSFMFRSKSRELSALLIKNALMSWFSLGLYLPNAYAEIRSKVWKSISLNKLNPTFTGSPRELRLPFALTALALTGLVGINYLLLSYPGYQILQIPLLQLAWHWRSFSSYQYLLRHTDYRGINFDVQSGAMKQYLLTAAEGLLLTIFTLGLYWPFLCSRLIAIRWSSTLIAGQSLSYEVRHRDYALQWFKGMMLSMLTLGVYFPWHRAAMHRFEISHLSLGSNTFESTVTGTDYLGMLLRIATSSLMSLGLALPFLGPFKLSIFIQHLHLHGALDFEALAQGRLESQRELPPVLELDVA